jgi:antitoxin StbD
MNSNVPITRLNRGEASKIFEEISEDRYSVVTKNNNPIGVLLKLKRFEEMVEMLKDYVLFFEAEKRLRNTGKADLISNEQVLQDLGISESDLEDVEEDKK